VLTPDSGSLLLADLGHSSGGSETVLPHVLQPGLLRPKRPTLRPRTLTISYRTPRHPGLSAHNIAQLSAMARGNEAVVEGVSAGPLSSGPDPGTVRRGW